MTYSAKSDLGGTISQFTRRKGIIINSGSSLSAYQIKLIISYESSMQTDFRDIRFNDASGNYCPYWIESKTDNITATVWTKTDLVTGSNIAYMYYGNASITSASDGNNTFIQYHGAATSPFLDSLLVPPTNIVYETYVSFTSVDTNIRYGVSNNANFLAGDSAFLGFYTYTGSYLLWNVVCNNGTNSNNNTAVTYSTWNRIMFKLSDTAFKGYLNNVETGTTLSTNLPNETMGIGAQIVSGTGTISQQYSFVRKYTSPEPTTCVGGEEVSAVSWLTNWNRRKLITITGSTNAQIDYQMKLTVHKSTGTDTSTDIYLGTNVNNDFSDLRFTSSDGSTLLNYWIESYTSGSIATVWIKIPSVPVSPCTTTIYLYYNNLSATITASSGTSTFSSFATIPNQNYVGSTTTAKWFFWHYDGSGNYSSHSIDDTGQTTSVSHRGNYGPGSGSNSLKWFAAGSNYVYEYSGMEEIHDEVMHLMRLDVPAVGDYRIGIQYTYDILQLSAHPAVLASIELSSFVSPLPTSGWNQGDWYEMIHTAGSSNLNVPPSFPSNYSVSRELNAASIGAKDSRGQILYVGIGVRTQGSNNGQWCYEEIKVDMANSRGYVRKYVSPEPIFSLISTEQIPSNITATLMTITPNETPCRHNICTVTVYVTWTNNGGITGSFVPNITIDTVPISPIYPLQELAPSANVTKTFVISNLAVGTRNICPYPN